jgi:flagellar L-ring protein precursor FlgH
MCFVVLAPASVVAQEQYDAAFKAYLEAARKQPAPTVADPGSWMNSLMGDTRARRVNDLITVQVVENITAAGSADAATGKTSSAGIGVSNFFGVENKLPTAITPSSLVAGKFDTQFKGSGTTTRAGQLTATMAARVAEVLPNGDLVIEGVREIMINGDRQLVMLTGVVRLADVAPNNVVLSSSIAQMRIQYTGKGLTKDQLQPGFLVRMLNKIF